MLQLTAVFNKQNLNNVISELYSNGIEGVTVIDVIGKGNLGFIEKDSHIDLHDKVMIVIVVSNEKHKEVAMEAIRSNTQDLGHGAGKMWTTPVVEVERIRTGEKNEDALTESADKKRENKDIFFTNNDTPSS